MVRSAVTSSVAVTIALLLFSPTVANAADEISLERIKTMHAKTTQLVEAKRYEDALQNAKNAYLRALDSLGTAHKSTAVLGLSKAHLLVATGREDEAVALYETTVDRYKNLYGKKSTKLIPVLLSLGDALGHLGKRTKQRHKYKLAVRLAKQSGDAELHADTLHTAGVRLTGIAASDALKYLSSALALYSELYAADDIRTIEPRQSLIDFLIDVRLYRGAIEELQKALTVFEQHDGYNEQTIRALTLIVGSYEQMGFRNMATPHCQTIGELSPWEQGEDIKPLYKATPKYPRRAARKRLEGHVTLSFTVDEFGFVRLPAVVDVEGPLTFAKEALAVIKKFRYAPRLVNGEAVDTPGVTYRFEFDLAN